MAPTPRRTQAERTAATTAKLLDAAEASLVELGWAGTSTTEVCRRAGVSRGALLHHYPTKDHLVAAAVHHVMDRCFQEFRVALTTLPAGTPLLTRLETAIDVLWSIFQGGTIAAWHELVVAARTDPAVGAIVGQARESLDAEVRAAWHELFPPDAQLPAAFFEVAPVYVLTLLDGLALRRGIGGAQDPDADLVLLATKLIVRTMSEADPAVLDRHLAALLGEPS